MRHVKEVAYLLPRAFFLLMIRCISSFIRDSLDLRSSREKNILLTDLEWPPGGDYLVIPNTLCAYVRQANRTFDDRIERGYNRDCNFSEKKHSANVTGLDAGRVCWQNALFASNQNMGRLM